MTRRKKIYGVLLVAIAALALFAWKRAGRAHQLAAAQLNAERNTDRFGADGSTLTIKQPCTPAMAKDMLSTAVAAGFSDVRCE